MPIKDCRWLCHTCKTVCDGGGMLSDIKTSDTGTLPTPTEARRLVRYHDQWSDPFAFHGAIASIKAHYLRFAEWRERHNNHRVQVLKQQDPWPKGTQAYTREIIKFEV